jgi:hypothetical protein
MRAWLNQRSGGSARRWVLVAAAASLAVVIFLALFGGRDPAADQELLDRSVVDPEDIPASLVTQREVRKQRPGSPRRAFFSYWRAIQQRSGPAVLERFDRGLVALIGEGRLLRALSQHAGTYATRRPRITGVDHAGNRADVQYLIADYAGSAAVVPHTVSLLHRDGAWRVIFDALLGASLKESQEQAVQDRVDPGAEPSAEASEAGTKAAGLQDRYLKRLGLARP